MQTSFKFNKGELVNKDDLIRLKERINSAFTALLTMHESTIDRDAFIVDNLLSTHLGKMNRLTVKRDIHDALKDFKEEISEPFEAPDIILSLKPEAAWRQPNSMSSTQVVK